MAYNDIDSGKVLNKEGLLELSGQIKGYIEDNIPQAYTLPTASTTALGGVKVDGETITISDGVISTASSGGATYTAGRGISIDENNVISSFDREAGFASSILNWADFNWRSSISTLDTIDDVIKALKNNKAVKMTKTKVYNGNLANELGLRSTDVWRFSADGAITNYSSINTSTFSFYIGNTYFIINGILCLFANNDLYATVNAIKYNNTSTDLSATNITGAIDELAGRIPASTTADGVYKLTSTVASGTPTYAWVEDSGSSGSGDDYKEVETISIENLQLNSDNSNILTQEQQAWFVNLYQKFSQQQVMPDVWINGNHILFYNTTPAITSNTVYFNLYGLSRPFTVNNYQLLEGLRYYNFMVIINEDGTALSDSRLEWYERTQKADSIPLRSVMNIAGHTTSNVNDAISTLASAYATKDYVDVKVPDVSTTATDGVYKLTSTVASGTATFSWEEDSGSSSGGVTYTAGSGIDITNNVISNNMPIPTDLLFGSIYASLASSNSEIVNEINGSFTYQAVDANEFIDYAKKSVWFLNTYGDNFTGANYTNLKNQLGVSTIRKLSISSSGEVKLSTQNTTLYYFGPEFLYYKFVKINQLGLFISIANIYDLKYLYQYLNPVPPAPTTDGDYVLKVSVSSGTPTYSWVEATTGGSY